MVVATEGVDMLTLGEQTWRDYKQKIGASAVDSKDTWREIVLMDLQIRTGEGVQAHLVEVGMVVSSPTHHPTTVDGEEEAWEES